MSDLFSVHKAIESAQEKALWPISQHEQTTQTFRIDATLKARADHICTQHGITLSAFLRECCEGLVGDYTFPSEK